MLCVALFVAIAVFLSSLSPVHASYEWTCDEVCHNSYNGLEDAFKLGQCVARYCTNVSSGTPDLSGGDDPDTSSTEKPLTGNECVAACSHIFSVVHPDEEADNIPFRLACINGCNTPGIYNDSSVPSSTIRSLTNQQTAERQRRAREQARIQAQETASIQDAQTRGLCVLKTSLSKGEAQSLLSRTITQPSVTNANLESVAIDESQRSVLCLYSSMKLITRYLFFMAGVASLLMILIAGLLWMRSGGDTEQQGKARKTLLAALMGFVIVLISQGILRILQSLL